VVSLIASNASFERGIAFYPLNKSSFNNNKIYCPCQVFFSNILVFSSDLIKNTCLGDLGY
jgi:hypothetical protein